MSFEFGGFPRGERDVPWIWAGAGVLAALTVVWLVIQRPSPAPPLEPLLAAGDDRHPVLVATFRNLSGDRELDWLRHGVAEMLVTGLSRSPELGVFGRRSLAAPDLRQGAGAADESLAGALELARVSGVATLVFGSFSPLGGMLRIDARLYDAASGELQGAEHAVTGPGRRLFSRVDAMARRLGSRLGAPLPAGAAALATVLTRDVEAYRAYLAGLEAAAGGRHREAIAAYERALKVDPIYPLAHYHLGIARWELGERDAARRALGRFLGAWDEGAAPVPEVAEARRRLDLP